MSGGAKCEAIVRGTENLQSESFRGNSGSPCFQYNGSPMHIEGRASHSGRLPSVESRGQVPRLHLRMPALVEIHPPVYLEDLHTETSFRQPKASAIEINHAQFNIRFNLQKPQAVGESDRTNIGKPIWTHLKPQLDKFQYTGLVEKAKHGGKISTNFEPSNLSRIESKRLESQDADIFPHSKHRAGVRGHTISSKEET